MNESHQPLKKCSMPKENTSIEIKKETEFQSSKPYPPINCGIKNSMYARIMLDNMAGNRSEMSAISLYTYNQLITDEHNEIAELFHKISIVEMRHLYIFGTLAKQLGADPRLWTSHHNRAVYWSPGFNQYPKALPQLIEHSLQEERFAVEKYTKQLNVIKDEAIIRNLKRIILDEELHVNILENYLNTYQ
ncbi:MAG: ferritin family protein [Acutalibacteraceae bacterium]|nr:ferritin family protein [Acutalibacteraceae bacterium]